MAKRNKGILFSIFISTAILVLFLSNLVIGQPFEDIHEKLIGISKEEKEILEKLFILIQEIENMEKEEEKLSLDIDDIKQEIKKLEIEISGEENIYEKNKEALKQVLKSYQRMGPGSYLEIILNSDSLAMLIRSINTLQDITRNTGDLLGLIEKSRDNLLLAQKSLNKNLLLIEEKQRQLEDALSAKIGFKEEIEEYLTSLEDEREYYQDYLSNLQIAWDKVGHTLSDTIRELSRIISEEELPQDALELTFSLLKVKGSMKDQVFNDLVKKYPSLPKMVFSFTPGKATLDFPDNNIVLAGKLLIVDGSALELKVEEGSFYNMPLESRTIEELLKDNKLIINLKPLLYGNKLDSVVMKQGYIELISTFKLF